MILLNKNSTAKVVLTLSENVTINTPVYFLFEVISDDTKESKFFTAEDFSANTCRYNEFDITLTSGATDPTIGLIDLVQNGYYKYNVYQQAEQFNMDPNQTDGIIENGKVYVKGELKPATTSYTDNDNNTYKAYQ
tara:strand:- start:422 stop:826 length:405 start_codon:yes stop_codon:yes gene_type:complete